jgi:drug/metabolite transporter (DMT)-like permease
MSVTALALILVAALAHASWNLFSKQASTAGRTSFIWLLALVAAVAYIPVVIITAVVVRPHLTGMNWLFMVGTGLLESGYFLFLQTGYQVGDLSLVYPIGRGTGALLAALAGIVILDERLGPVALAGIAAIIIGIVVIGIPAKGGGQERRTASLKAVAFAVATGTFVASYTLWDKYAVTTLHTPAVFQGYATFPVMLTVLAPLAVRNRPQVAEVWRTYRPQVIGAALLAPLAYMLVLAALSFTAVAVVAPSREISVLFGVILGRRLLGEGGLPRKLAAAAAIVAGILAIALG